MAIYSLRMTAIGKTTQGQPFTSAAHLKYITRKAAVTHVMAARMPEVRRHAIAWLKREEREDRKNARVIDKLVLALPRELSAGQQHALVAAFAEKLTLGRASWFAAFHTKGKDRDNPHCHLVVRDRDFETGRRVMFLSAGKKESAERQGKGQAAPTTLLKVRELWERCANAALELAGREERIDRRSLREQGIGRRAQVHEGPNIRAMHRRGFRPASRNRVVRNNPFRRRGRSTSRVVRYAEIDRGMTRVEYNASLKQPSRATVEVRTPGRAVTAAAEVVVPVLAPAIPLPVVHGPRPFLGPVLQYPAAFRPAVHERAQSAEVSAWQNWTEQPDRPPLVIEPPVPVPAFAAPQPVPAPSRPMTLTEMIARDRVVPVAQPRSDQVRDRGRGRGRVD